MNILMIAPGNYEPENRDGTKKILYNIIKRNADWKVDLVSFNDFVSNDKLENVHNIFVKNRRFNMRNIFQSPWALRIYAIDRLKEKVKDILLEKKYDLVVCVTGLTAELINILPAEYQNKSILLAIDSMSLFWERRASLASGIKKLLANIQVSLWKRHEKRYYDKFESVIFVSKVDKQYNYVHTKNKKVLAIENGVDTTSFCYKKYSQCQKNLIFTGNMMYGPNIEAVEFLIEKIYPKLQREFSGLKLYIVGIGSNQLRNKYIRPGVIYIDYVEDMCAALAKANIYVSPLMQGAGIKNKILEAMAVGKLIVGSPISFDGIEGLNKEDVAIVNNEAEYFQQISRYLNYSDEQAHEIGQRLSGLIKQKYSWSFIAERYDKVFKGVAKIE